MNATRVLLLLPLCAAILLTGCRTRGQGLQNTENESEKARLTRAVDELGAENDKLRKERDEARSELIKLQEQGNSVGGQLQDLLNGGNIGGVTATENGSLALSEDYSFAKGSAELNDDGKKSVAQLAERLNKGEYASKMIIVEGHTDDTPVSRHSTVEKYGDNWGLSAARAATVLRSLEKSGVSAARLRGSFRGEHQPRSGGKDKSANRRVELYVR
ncbi:MAG: OmpA family protein [Planctomycetes bacterium]|nr:OmpA family protein [Planctomycetota bacterium]